VRKRKDICRRRIVGGGRGGEEERLGGTGKPAGGRRKCWNSGGKLVPGRNGKAMTRRKNFRKPANHSPRCVPHLGFQLNWGGRLKKRPFKRMQRGDAEEAELTWCNITKDCSGQKKTGKLQTLRHKRKGVGISLLMAPGLLKVYRACTEFCRPFATPGGKKELVRRWRPETANCCEKSGEGDLRRSKTCCCLPGRWRSIGHERSWLRRGKW